MSPRAAARSVGMSKVSVMKSPADQTSSALSVSSTLALVRVRVTVGVRVKVGVIRLGL